MKTVTVYYYQGSKHEYVFVTLIGAMTFASEQRHLANVAEVRIN